MDLIKELFAIISDQSKPIDAHDVMSKISSIKSILINPFYTSGTNIDEGSKIKYIVDIGGLFLQGSSLVTNTEDKVMLKEWIGGNNIISEQLYIATRDGFG